MSADAVLCTNVLYTALKMDPLDYVWYCLYSDDVAASGQAMSSVVNDSLSFELTRHRHGQHNHGDYIPEEGRNMGGGEVIHNPNTSI